MPPCLFLHFLLISGLQNLGFLAEKGLLISICAAFARYEKLDYLECVLFFEDFSVGFEPCNQFGEDSELFENR